MWPTTTYCSKNSQGTQKKTVAKYMIAMVFTSPDFFNDPGGWVAEKVWSRKHTTNKPVFAGKKLYAQHMHYLGAIDEALSCNDMQTTNTNSTHTTQHTTITLNINSTHTKPTHHYAIVHAAIHYHLPPPATFPFPPPHCPVGGFLLNPCGSQIPREWGRGLLHSMAQSLKQSMRLMRHIQVTLMKTKTHI